MPLVVLSGATGVGKSTVQRRLVAEHGMVALTSYTTRAVDGGDFATNAIDEAALRDEVRRGSKVAPIRFAGSWYTWDREELQQALLGTSLYVVTARPYTALLLSGTHPSVLPVLLTVEPEELSKRRARRAAARDSDITTGAARRLIDEGEVADFETFFAQQVAADDHAPGHVAALCIERFARTLS